MTPKPLNTSLIPPYNGTRIDRFSLLLHTPKPLNTSLTSNFQHHHHDEEEGQRANEDDAADVSDRRYWSRRVHALCAVERDPDAALRLVDRLRLRGYLPDSLNLSSVIHSLCLLNRFDEAHHRLLVSTAAGWLPDDRTANVVLARLIDSRTPLLTLRVFNALAAAKPAFVPSLTNYNRLIDDLCSNSSVHEAKFLVSEMWRKGRSPNTITYTTLINGLCKNGHIDDARKAFDEMHDNGILPNSLTSSVLIKGLLRKRRLEEAKELTRELWLSMGQERDPSVNSAAFANLIDALCHEGYFHEVFRILEEMPQGNNVDESFTYSHMIDSLCRSGRYHGAARIVYTMRKRGFLPSLISYNSIVHGLSKNRGCMRAYQLFKEGIDFGYSPSEPTYKVLVEGLCHEMDVQKAKVVTEFMLQNNGVDKTRIYNIFLSALRLVDNPSEQLNVLVWMLQNHCQPDVVTLNTVIHGFCRLGRVKEAIKILDDMLKGKFAPPDIVSFTTIIQGLLDVGKCEEALDIFYSRIPKCSCAPNVVTYNVLIRGLCKLQNVEKAIEVFEEMSGNGVHADSSTYTAIIDGLCQMGRLEEVKKLWDIAIWPSKVHDDYVYAAILRGLCFLGKLDEACDFLYELVDCGVSPGIVNYNILISSACQQCLKREAYEIVGEMRKNGLEPDAVTWRILDRMHDKKRLENVTAEESLTSEKSTGSRQTTRELDDENSLVIDREAYDEPEVFPEQLEGLVDPTIDDEFIKEDDTYDPGCEKDSLAGDNSTQKFADIEAKEPLSKIARKVFGLM